MSPQDLPSFLVLSALRLDVDAKLSAYSLRPSHLDKAEADSRESIFSCFRVSMQLLPSA